MSRILAIKENESNEEKQFNLVMKFIETKTDEKTIGSSPNVWTFLMSLQEEVNGINNLSDKIHRIKEYVDYNKNKPD